MIKQLYDSVVYDHDLVFLMVAVFICLLSSFTAISLHQRAKFAQNRKHALNWVLLSAVAIGSGMWATYFIAMVAYDAGMPIRYSLVLTGLSIVVAIALSAAAFAIVVFKPGRWYRALAGAVMCVGIGAMHYIGVSAFNVQGAVSQTPSFVVASLVFGAFFSILGFVSLNRTHDYVRYVVSALLLTLAICALHFWGIAGIEVSHTAAVTHPVSYVSADALAIGASLVSIALLVLSFSSTLTGQSFAAKQAYQASRFRKLADATLESIVVMDKSSVIINSNKSFLALTGLSLAEVRGKMLSYFLPHIAGTELSNFTATDSKMEETQLLLPSKQAIPVEVFFRNMEVSGGLSRYVLIIRDVSEKRAAERKIAYLTNYDVLTGFLNRQLFMDRLQHAVWLSESSEEYHTALLYLDVDGFNELNSIYGNAVCDDLLKAISVRLKSCSGYEQTLARIGADQFCMIMEYVENTAEVEKYADKILNQLKDPFDMSTGTVAISVSVGIAISGKTAKDADNMLEQAEIAMRQAKKEVGTIFYFYEDQYDKGLLVRRQLKKDMATAVADGDMFLVFQPQFDCMTRNLIGFEALLRWQHPELGMISPVEFIPLAEESGQIIALGKWVVEEACRKAAMWHPNMKVAVNLSPLQFQRNDLYKTISEALEQYGVDPCRLELEITEGVLMENTEAVLSILQSFKQLGIRLAMDDFGTGYSSLAYLQKFPFDKLKIDRSFIAEMQSSQHSLNIIRGIIGLAKGLNMSVLAEGVETEVQLAILRAEGCDEIQGYLLGKPQRIEQYQSLLDTMSFAN